MSKRSSAPEVGPGRVLRAFDVEATAGLVEQWLAVFGADRHGVNAKDYLWHIFSAERYPSLSGDAALAMYGTQTEAEYIVLSNDRKHAFSTDVRPDSCSLSDWYVFPPDLAWTMCFTHEDGWLGPYFAMHSGYAARKEADIAKLRKAREIEEARRKGWI